ncbi:MAG: hypothetical protein ACM30G_10040 [Micromonosporaceae bacterium]
MQGAPAVSDLHCIIDAIVNSHSGFEQFHALSAAESVVDRLSADERARLREAIEGEMAPDRHIRAGTARRRIAKRVLARLA